MCKQITCMSKLELIDHIRNQQATMEGQRRMIRGLQVQLTRALECVAANHLNNRSNQQERTF